MKNSQKNIIDHIQKNNLDPGSIAIAKILITSFKEVHQEYQEAIEEEKKNEKGINQNNQLRILNNEILDFEKKKEGLAQCAHLYIKDLLKSYKELKEKMLQQCIHMSSKHNFKH